MNIAATAGNTQIKLESIDLKRSQELILSLSLFFLVLMLVTLLIQMVAQPLAHVQSLKFAAAALENAYGLATLGIYSYAYATRSGKALYLTASVLAAANGALLAIMI
jgi:hypothetical protein